MKIVSNTFIVLLLNFSILALHSGRISEYGLNDFADREYELFVPSEYSHEKATSLLFVFHGAGGTAIDMKFGTKLKNYAGKKNFIICYPQAAGENWEEGCKCNKPYRLGIDDVGFVKYLIKKLSGKYNIDSTKIFGVGYSQGGLFAMNVACKLSNLFNGIATVAATMSLPLYNECSPPAKTSVLIIHGTDDKVLPYSGANRGEFSLIGAEEAAEFWANINECAAEPATTALTEKKEAYLQVVKYSYNSCSNEKRVVLYKIINGGHYWFDEPEFNAAEVIVEFFFNKN